MTPWHVPSHTSAAAGRLLLASVMVVCAGLAMPKASATEPVVPDFSGRWKFDAAKSGRLAPAAQGNAATGIFGEDCTIVQTPGALVLDIVAGALKVQATYRLDGRPSENRSPGPPGQPDILVFSTTRWVDAVLYVTTRSESNLGGTKVPVESLRKIWLTAEGDLAIERHGTPANIVPDAWAVYTRVKAAGG